MSSRRILFLLTLMVILVIATFAVKSIVLRGSVVRLQPSTPLAGAVSQGLATFGSEHSLPQLGKDYTLQDIRYFDNKTWVIATVVPLRIHTDNALLVIRMVGGSYQVVLGPGTAFPNTYLRSLPADVSEYLINRGVIYEPTTNQ
jgi:hypothetical protein